MVNASLVSLVLILGFRHGLDADHLAFIDGQTRHNWRMGKPVARWVGTLFSFGHGLVVLNIAVILGMFSSHFKFPRGFDAFSTWISIFGLLLIGTLNILNLVSKSQPGDFQIRGLKGKFIPRFAKETTNPFIIILIGSLFALAADTISQTSVWAITASNTATYMPFILGLIFMVGMMITDTIDSMITYRMLKNTSKRGQSASKLMGWVIVILAYGVSLYEIVLVFAPSVQVSFEFVGIAVFVIIFCCYFAGLLTIKKKSVTNS